MEAAPFSSASGARDPGTQSSDQIHLLFLHVLLLQILPSSPTRSSPKLIGSFPAFPCSLFFLSHLLPFHPSPKWPHSLALLRGSLTRVCYLLLVFRSFVICQGTSPPLHSKLSLLKSNTSTGLGVCVYYLKAQILIFLKDIITDTKFNNVFKNGGIIDSSEHFLSSSCYFSLLYRYI